MRLHVKDEILTLGKLLSRGRAFQRLRRLHIPVRAIDHVAGEERRGHTHGAAQKIALGHAEML